MNIGTTTNHVYFVRDAGHQGSGVFIGCGFEAGYEFLICLGPSVRQYPNIGSTSIVGAGSAILKDAPEHRTAMFVVAGVQTVYANYKFELCRRS